MVEEFLNIDITAPILQNFKNYVVGFVALHPFYKKVFHDTYDYFNQLDLTYPLIETVSWENVANEIGFKQLDRLATALVESNVSYHKELCDYIEYKNFDLPLIEEDTIPADIIIPILKAAVKADINVTKGFSQDTFENERVNIIYKLHIGNLFDIAKDLLNCYLFELPEITTIIMLPMKDCPYTLILTQKKEHADFIKQLQLEGFFIDSKTKFNWWEK